MPQNSSVTLPEAFVEAVASELGDDMAERILASMTAPKDICVWVNGLMPEAETASGSAAPDVLSRLGAVPVPGFDDLFRVTHPHREALMHDPEVERGRLYPINPASVAAVAALAPLPGEEVLDLAAAPGGKSIQIAARMRNEGRLAAVEVVPKRFHRLRANLARCGVTIAELYLDDGRHTGRKVGERFDRVLLDAPCASEARLHVEQPRRLQRWHIKKRTEIARKQKALLRSAFTSLRPGGRLVYCTCSYSLAENEGVVSHLLRREQGADLVTLPSAWYAGVATAPGIAIAPGRPLDERVQRCARILPDALVDGMFVALISKAVGE